MAKQRPEKSTPKETTKTASVSQPAGGWPLWARLTVSVWVVWHLFAVFISPFNAFSAPRASELVAQIATSPWLRWYSDPIYINGGYQFFSPDPPEGGALVRYRVTDDRGELIVQGEFPNRANENYSRQWPRLWYHRHMMLADQSAEALVYWTDDGLPNRLENTRLTMRAYARHLLRKHGGTQIDLDYLNHRSLFPNEAVPSRVAEEGVEPPPPVDPADPSLYSVILSVRESADQLATPLLPQSSPPGGVAPQADPLPGLGGLAL